MTFWDAIFITVGLAFGICALSYSTGYWFTKGKFSALKSTGMIHPDGDCGDEDCPVHGRGD